jgi:hypothetical protein
MHASHMRLGPFSPLAQLLSEHTAPELLYVASKFASLISHGLSVQLLQEVLPIENAINAATVRNHVHAVVQRIDADLGYEQVFFIMAASETGSSRPSRIGR